jgi:uncharacterized protein (TIGR02001 family)
MFYTWIKNKKNKEKRGNKMIKINKKTIFNFICALVICASVLIPTSVFAQEAAAPKAEKYFDLAGTLAFTTDYLFRGQTQTFGGPAIQGSLEVQKRGFLVGVWASNVSGTQYPNGSGKELDAYFGYNYKHNDDLSAKILAYWYLYPGAKYGAPYNENFDTMELIPSVTYRWLTATFAYSVTDAYGVNNKTVPIINLTPNGNTKGSWYAEGALRIPLFRDDLALSLVYGYRKMRNYGDLSYSTYGASVDYTLPESLHALNLKVGVNGTNNNKQYYTAFNADNDNVNIGRTRLYFTLTKIF